MKIISYKILLPFNLIIYGHSGISFISFLYTTCEVGAPVTTSQRNCVSSGTVKLTVGLSPFSALLGLLYTLFPFCLTATKP